MKETIRVVLMATLLAFMICCLFLGILTGGIAGGGELFRSKNHDPRLGAVYTGSLFSESHKQCFGPALTLYVDNGVFAVVQDSKECTP